MKARATLVLVLVLSLALVPILTSVPVHAQSQYTERLDVYTAGQNGFWSISLDRLGASLPVVTSVESATGLTGYRLVAMSAQSAVSDFQTFGVDGYNLLKLPSTPAEGLFLTVNSTTTSAQSSVVSAFATEFGTSFTLVSSAGDSSTYFAPVDFVDDAAPILFPLVPSSLGGFASFVSSTTLAGLPMPFIELTGTYNGTGFSHQIAFGADSSNVLSSSAMDLSSLIGSTNATLKSSNSSSSSQVVIHSLDGVIVSSDSAATVSNDVSNFSGTYTLAVNHDTVVRVNATIQSQPPTAVAYRILDHGSLVANDTLGVTIEIADTALTGALLNVTLNDNWWMTGSNSNLFQLTSSGANNYSIFVPVISAGANVNETYVLKVISSAKSQVVIPAATVTYEYQLGADYYTGHATLGQQVIQLNGIGPALSVTAHSSIKSGSPLGTAGNYTITITNDGNSPALDLKLGSYSLNTLAQNGGTSTIQVPIQLTSLAQRNLTKTFSLEFSNTQGQSQNITANSVQLLLSHTGMILPFIHVTTNDTLNAAELASKTLNVTYTFTNAGKGTPDGITATETFPSGFTCTVANKSLGTCSGNTYTLKTTTVTTQRNDLELTFGQDNYVIQPTVVVTDYQGLQLHTFGGSYAIPAGIVLTKTFSPDAAFPGASSTVTVVLSNDGSLPIYNASIASGQDPFDSGSNAGSKMFSEVSPGSSSSYSYNVTVSSSLFGNVSGILVSTTFILGGATQALLLGSSSMVVYKPVTATVTTSPSSPEENHDFVVTITITNSAPVSVSNVVYTVPIPNGVSVVSGATLSNHEIALTVSSMQADSNNNVSVTLSTGTGLTIDTSAAHLTFQYQGANLNGVSVATKIVVRVDATTRYTIPIAIAVIIALAAVFYVRRKVGTVASP
jgi:hypothetical protein